MKIKKETASRAISLSEIALDAVSFLILITTP
jgi:hypothetical protein